MNEACAFCGIVAGTTPAERVYEDDAVVAVMDINPATKGHVVVMSKNHSADLWEVPIGDAQRVMAASVRVARMIRDSLEPHGLNLVHASGSAAWQTVFHFHVHVVPRYRGDGLIPHGRWVGKRQRLMCCVTWRSASGGVPRATHWRSLSGCEPRRDDLRPRT